MALVVAMGDHISHLDPTLSPLFNTYDLSPEDIEVIVSRDLYDSDDARKLKNRKLLRATDGDLVSHLTGRGIPEQDAMFYAQGIEQNKDLILVEVDSTNSGRVANYFRHNEMTEIRESGSDYEMATPPASKQKARPAKQQAGHNVQGEETFEVIEEELKVGKRTVEQGGVRVEKKVEVTPVEEEIVLKEERAVVHRQPVHREAADSELDAAFKDETYEIREYKQEAVVEKEAHVVEEVTLGKVVEEDVEVIREKLRRIDVDVHQLSATKRNDGFGYDTFRPMYMKHYNTTYGDKGPGFDRFERAYQFGYAYATEPRMKDYSYSALEPRMREDWNSRFSSKDDEYSTWDKVKDSISHAWNTTKSKMS